MDNQKLFRLSELVERPELLEPPAPVVAPLAYEGRLTLLAGREKLGKTTLVRQVIANASVGESLDESVIEPKKVLAFFLEDSLGDSTRMLLEAGADPDLVWVADHLDHPNEIYEFIEEVEPDLVIIDSLSKWGSAVVNDWIQSGPVTKLIGKLADTVHRDEISMILTHHGTKGNGNYRDSTAIGASVDLILEMHEGRGKNGRRITARGRINNVEDFELRFVDGRYELGDASAFLPIEERVYRFVEDHPGCSSTEIRSGISGSSASKDKAVQRLLDDHRIYQRNEPGGKLSHYIVQMAIAQHEIVGNESSMTSGTP